MTKTGQKKQRRRTVARLHAQPSMKRLNQHALKKRLAADHRPARDIQSRVLGKLVNRATLSTGGNLDQLGDSAPVDNIYAHLFPTSKVQERQESAPKHLALSDDQRSYMHPMVKKYGRDTASMFRDIRLNYLQHSERQIERMCQAWYDANLESDM